MHILDTLRRLWTTSRRPFSGPPVTRNSSHAFSPGYMSMDSPLSTKRLIRRRSATGPRWSATAIARAMRLVASATLQFSRVPHKKT